VPSFNVLNGMNGPILSNFPVVFAMRTRMRENNLGTSALILFAALRRIRWFEKSNQRILCIIRDCTVTVVCVLRELTYSVDFKHGDVRQWRYGKKSS